MTTKKERKEALERMTKAELVRTVVALDKRQVVLLNEVQHTKDLYDAQLAVSVALQRRVQELRADLNLSRSVASGMSARLEVDNTKGHGIGPSEYAADARPVEYQGERIVMPWERS